MSEHVQNSISELLKESSQFNTNDVLVNVDVDNSKLLFSAEQLVFKTADFPKAILREAEKTKKESGVNSLCVATGTVGLKIGDKEVTTPILLTPVQIVKNKIKDTITLVLVEDGDFVNPFLKMYIPSTASTGLEINTLEGEESVTEITPLTPPSMGEAHRSIISSPSAEIEPKIYAVLRELELEVNEASIIGNFHHHRYEIVKELEELLQLETCSKNIHNLFGESSESSELNLNLPPDLLFPADVDHEAVFIKASVENTVIQGPPGTGKSQVLSNVLGKILAGNNTTVVVSEKRVALEVLQNKLSSFGLDKLCFIASSDRLSHSFLQELKSTWDYFESYKFLPQNNLRLSEQYEANLQMTLDLLAQKELIGGVSFHEFKTLVSDRDVSSFNYSSNAPSITHFLAEKDKVKELYKCTDYFHKTQSNY